MIATGLVDKSTQDIAADIRQKLNQIHCPCDNSFVLCEQIIELGRSLPVTSAADAETYTKAINIIIANPLSDRHSIALVIQLAEVMELFLIDIDGTIPSVLAEDKLVQNAIASFNEAADENRDLEQKIFI